MIFVVFSLTLIFGIISPLVGSSTATSLYTPPNTGELDEVIDFSKPHTIFDQNATWKAKTLTDFTAKELLVPIFKDGECVYESPKIEDIAKYCKDQIGLLWDEVKRFENPHNYYVDLSKKLWDIKNILLNIYQS